MSEPKKIDDGGPAFPQTAHTELATAIPYTRADNGGISKRDYFAAKALQGMLAESAVNWGTIGTPHNPSDWYATKAYLLADAMIAAGKATP